MSHSYSSFRHGKNHSSSSTSSTSSSSSHQRVSYGSRSTSTGTPPQTPTIRVTSPVPDAVGVIDIWDPEVTDDEPQATSPKSYSFRYKEEKQHKRHSKHRGKKNFTDSGMQADVGQQQQQQPIVVQEEIVETVENSPTKVVVASAATMAPVQSQLGDASPIEDDGLKTAGESEESSDCDEISQISAVTQVAAGCQSSERWTDQAEGIQVDDSSISPADEKTAAIQPDPPPSNDEPTKTLTKSQDVSDCQRRWDETHPMEGKPIIKRVQFSRSLSLVPGSSAAQSVTSEILNEHRSNIRSGAGRRYSSMDSGAGPNSAPIDIFPTIFIFADQQQQQQQQQPVFPASGGKMLSPTPESALENAQSPQQEAEPDSHPTIVVHVDELKEEQSEEHQEELKKVQEEEEEHQASGAASLANPSITELLSVTVEDTEGNKDHDPTCDLFDRLNALKNDEELMDLATGFVLQLLRSAQEEALKRGHVPSKMEQKSKMSLELQHVAVPKGRNNRKWYSRLRTLLLRTLTCTCVPTHPNIQSPLSN